MSEGERAGGAPLGAPMAGDDLLPEERRVLEALGHLPLDFRAMSAVSNLFRCSAAIRRHMEAEVLSADRLSWTAFTGLWVLWIWGEMEARDFAATVGISRPTATGVVTTLEGRGYVRRRKDERDGRMVLVSLTPAGRGKIGKLFPRFNAEETAVTTRLSDRERELLAGMLRSLLRTVEPGKASASRAVSKTASGPPSAHSVASGTGGSTRAPSA